MVPRMLGSTVKSINSVRAGSNPAFSSTYTPRANHPFEGSSKEAAIEAKSARAFAGQPMITPGQHPGNNSGRTRTASAIKNLKRNIQEVNRDK